MASPPIPNPNPTRTEMTHNEMITVITHHLAGGKVECRCKGDGVWINECHLDARGFNFADFDYRAKPEPLVIYVEIDKLGIRYGTSSAMFVPCNGGTIKKFVEVTE